MSSRGPCQWGRRMICRFLIGAFAFAAVAWSSESGLAQDYPSRRPIRLLVALSAGSPTDIIARQISSVVEKVINQSIVIENRVGGGSSIAAAALTQSPADGYTLLFGSSQISAAPALMDAVRDMTGHWPDSAVHFEDFAGATANRADDTPFMINLAKSGKQYEVPAGVSILDTLRKHGHMRASSCESGTCGTCRTRYLAGEADHRDLVLSDREKRSDIMICVSRSKSPELTLDI